MLFVILSVYHFRSRMFHVQHCYLNNLGGICWGGGGINLVLTSVPLLNEFDPGGNDLVNDSKVIESAGGL